MNWRASSTSAAIKGCTGSGSAPPEVMLHPAERGSGRSGLFFHAGVDDVHAHFLQATESGLFPRITSNRASVFPAPYNAPGATSEFELEDPEGHWWAFTQS